MSNISRPFRVEAWVQPLKDSEDEAKIYLPGRFLEMAICRYSSDASAIALALEKNGPYSIIRVIKREGKSEVEVSTHYYPNKEIALAEQYKPV